MLFTKPKPIVTRSHMFSRASSRLYIFLSSFDWFNGLSVSFAIDQGDYFGENLSTDLFE